MGKHKKIIKAVSSRITLVVIGLALQFAWYFFTILFLTESNPVLYALMWFVAIGTVLYVLNTPMNPAYKLTWTILILAAPIVGLIFYFVGGKSRVARKYVREVQRMRDQGERDGALTQRKEVTADLQLENPLHANQMHYLTAYCDAPAYENTEAEYFPVGEEWFSCYLEELKKAKRYIFMEYFIISQGKMWAEILSVLRQKAAEGVEVRILYDGVGTLTTLPNKYYRTLQSYGIQCACFNPFRPFLNIVLNNRDHRKITVIDGKVGFGGGINLADEYINEKHRFGHWKDSGFCLRGEAVWSLTVMFLTSWSVITRVRVNIMAYRPDYDILTKKILLKNRAAAAEYTRTEDPESQEKADAAVRKMLGYVQPYDDSPMDGETVGENVYRNMLSGATKNCYIFTPYLILDNEMMTELCNASKRGVDVRIVTPAIPDKKLIFLLTQSYYGQLLEAGVRIYEYTPGFIHAKSFVVDGEIAAVGSINLDFRSLYLHFENGALFFHTPCVKAIEEDARKTFAVSREVHLEEVQNRHVVVRFFQSILRAFAPIL